MKRLRAAVVGCGWIGSEVADDPLADGIQAHAAAYVSSTATTLIAVCDRDAARAAKAAHRWGLSVGHTDLGTMLVQTRPEIVSVCTPDSTHASVLRQVLESDSVRAVIAEKPLALDLHEAGEIVSLARRRAILLAVNYVRRYSSSHAAVREQVLNGAIGSPVAASGLYTKGVLHNGTHWFDLAHWLMGRVSRVQAWGAASDPSLPDPTCHVRMEFETGATGFLLGLDERRYTAFEIDLLGTRGRLRLTDSGLRETWSTLAPSPHYMGYTMLRQDREAAGTFKDVGLRLVENVVAALRGEAALACGGEEAIAALAVAHAARESLRSGVEIEVDQLKRTDGNK